MTHLRSLAWTLTAIAAFPVAGCGDRAGNAALTAPSALSVSSGAHAKQTTILENAPFKGHDSGTFEFTQDTCAANLVPLRTHTTGTATLIGAYSFDTQECFDDATLTFSGSFTITAANGDKLSGDFAGKNIGFLDEVTAINAFTATVTQGTGRFVGATGTVPGTAQANLATFQESRTFSGTISVPRDRS
jgi:hypothetical protein